jgi:hypothetical protein
MEKTWEDLYEEQLQAKKNTLFDLDKQARAARQELREVKGELDKVKDRIKTIDTINTVVNATHFVSKDDYGIYDKSDFTRKVLISLDLSIDSIKIECPFILCGSEKEAKEKLTEYIHAQVGNGQIHQGSQLPKILTAIERYSLKINCPILEEMKGILYGEYKDEFENIQSDFNTKLQRLKEVSINNFSKIGHNPVDIISSANRMISKEVFGDE